ncbi:hypothetical protein [Sphingomonas quercus]|uniref:Uncharacterized protein n=1 Tax=Sphingomonas quercus TaxID=2842451 RepID=A0ABS6BM39_9SPHN|nr:hypothetical protein [Sphingomonas quercus]MBU3079368.1 hypothetical protein [Sphingomonas quercus]
MSHGACGCLDDNQSGGPRHLRHLDAGQPVGDADARGSLAPRHCLPGSTRSRNDRETGRADAAIMDKSRNGLAQEGEGAIST